MSDEDLIYVVWPEGDFRRAEYCKTRWGAELLAFWVVLKTWLRRDPQRVCIGFADTDADY